MSTLLILTVGTGTGGPHSDVAAGLARTIELTAPRLFWLVPSASPLSTPVADLIRESVSASSALSGKSSFCPWSEVLPYHAIENPDDIHQCREVMREVIAAARKHLRPGERLIINPTGGTKQMSAGATLAALDEEIGELMFTTGERENGVVKTGTEQTRIVSTAIFFLERDLARAGELFAAGAFFAAARLLRKYKDEPQALIPRETALCMHEWQRMNYERAAGHAARFSEDLRRHLKSLSEADEFSAARLGDLLAGAQELQRWGDCEEALARYYRGAEHAAKVRLAEAYSLRPPYWPDAIQNLLPANDPFLSHLSRRSRTGPVLLTAQSAWDLLSSLGDPMAKAYFADPQLQEGLQKRNESMYGHGVRQVTPEHVQRVADRFRNLLKQQFPAACAAWSTARRPQSLLAGPAWPKILSPRNP